MRIKTFIHLIYFHWISPKCLSSVYVQSSLSSVMSLCARGQRSPHWEWIAAISNRRGPVSPHYAGHTTICCLRHIIHNTDRQTVPPCHPHLWQINESRDKHLYFPVTFWLLAAVQCWKWKTCKTWTGLRPLTEITCISFLFKCDNAAWLLYKYNRNTAISYYCTEAPLYFSLRCLTSMQDFII